MPQGDTVYDQFYQAEQQRKDRIKTFGTLRLAEDYRNAAVWYTDNILIHKINQEDNTENIRQWLSANLNINTRNESDQIIRYIVFNPDTDVIQQYISEAKQIEYKIKHKQTVTSAARLGFKMAHAIEVERQLAEDREQKAKNTKTKIQHRLLSQDNKLSPSPYKFLILF